MLHPTTPQNQHANLSKRSIHTSHLSPEDPESDMTRELTTFEKWTQYLVAATFVWFVLCFLVLALAWAQYKTKEDGNLPECTEISEFFQFVGGGLFLLTFAGAAAYDPGCWVILTIFFGLCCIAFSGAQIVILTIFPVIIAIFVTYLIPWPMIAMQVLMIVLMFLLFLTDYFGSARQADCKELIIERGSSLLYYAYAVWSYTALIISSTLILGPALFSLWKCYIEEPSDKMKSENDRLFESNFELG